AEAADPPWWSSVVAESLRTAAGCSGSSWPSTSRNVRGGRLTDALLGGLNYQIEHHLFPGMPTPHLRRAQVIVRAYCAEIGVPYHETGLIHSYREALTHLHRVGEPIRRQRRTAA
ncbi:fatty acid desaturase family protein, partial [Streptomyces eurythermus]